MIGSISSDEEFTGTHTRVGRASAAGAAIGSILSDEERTGLYARDASAAAGAEPDRSGAAAAAALEKLKVDMARKEQEKGVEELYMERLEKVQVLFYSVNQKI